MDRPPPGKRANRAAQQGSIAVAMAGVLLLGLILLGSVQIGYTAYIKRELQKTADAAALSGVQVLGAGDQAGCDAALTAARINTGQNFPGLAQGDVTAECGIWDQDTYRSIVAEKADAVRVSIRSTFGSIVPFVSDSQISVEAVASHSEPIAVFSIGPRLVEFNNDSVVGGLLHTLGLDVSALSVLSERGVLDSRFKMGRLLQELGLELEDVNVGGMDSLLDTRIGLQNVLNAGLRAANQEEFLHVGTSLVQSVESTLGVSGLDIPLGGESGGLFGKIGTQSLAGALNADLRLEEFIGTALAVATMGNALTLDVDEVDLGFLSVQVESGIVEPPSINIGGPNTTVYSAQVRTFADIRLDTSKVLNLPFLDRALKLTLDLPITVDAVRGKATLLDGMCASMDEQGRPLAEIEAETTALGICVGNHPNLFSTVDGCEAGLQPKSLMSFRLLGSSIAGVNTKLAFSVPPSGSEPEKKLFHAGQSRMMPEEGSNLPLGEAVSKVMDTVLASLLVGSAGQSGTSLTAAERKSVAQEFWDAADTGCNVSPSNNRQAYECRSQRLQRASESMEDGLQGLQGFLGGLGGDTLNLLGDLLSLDVGGVLGSVGNVVDSTLGLVGNLLGGLLGGLFGNNDECAGRTGVLGLAYSGTADGCITKLSNTLNPPSSNAPPSAVLAVLGQVLGLLSPVLDSLGSAVAGVLRDIAGTELLQSEVRLISLQCGGAPRLMR
ncbi:pilus assembly protein TadG-related protein [Paracandidimonas soli]|uniref:Putative membrane protein n=1 Tax=Paracandidimonas soli TaxID=1917182 RepID=A0A4R3VAM2_9BURK|nr:pilus assembly protein TadG-related protein [Paracandidimonas soli]TCV00632.1 putative membrane protein [Paracandidimonas soli]